MQVCEEDFLLGTRVETDGFAKHCSINNNAQLSANIGQKVHLGSAGI